MTWEEAFKAFKKQVPVIFTLRRQNPIECTRIYEVGIRCINGRFGYFVVGLDKSNSLYYGTPKQFSVKQAGEAGV